MSYTAAKILIALSNEGFISTAGLASWLKVDRGSIIDAFDEIEAAGIKLMRVRGIGGGAALARKRGARKTVLRTPAEIKGREASATWDFRNCDDSGAMVHQVEADAAAEVA